MDEKGKSGFIRIYRSLLDWEWYTDVPVRVLFEHCLLKANHTEKKWRSNIIPRGSFITSLENLSCETGLTVSQVRTALKKLNLTNEIASKGQSSNTVITVNNYDLFQDNSKQIANKSQTNRKQIATTNELKELKEYIDINNTTNNIVIGQKQQPKIKKFVKPTIEEIKAYCSERKNNIDAEYFFNYYESKGWIVGKTKMKSWKSAVITWEKNNFNKGGDNNAGNATDTRRNPNESKYSRENGWF